MFSFVIMFLSRNTSLTFDNVVYARFHSTAEYTFMIHHRPLSATNWFVRRRFRSRRIFFQTSTRKKRKRHIFVYDEQPYSYFREKDSSSHLFSEWQQGVEMKEERSFSLKAGNKSYMRVKFFISLRFISIYFWILAGTLENIIS